MIFFICCIIEASDFSNLLDGGTENCFAKCEKSFYKEKFLSVQQMAVSRNVLSTAPDYDVAYVSADKEEGVCLGALQIL